MLSATAADRRLMPEGRSAGPMPWVIAIMAFLTALATMCGLSLASIADGLQADLHTRLTIQIMEPNADHRLQAARDIERRLAKLPGVRDVSPVDAEAMGALLEPWLGSDFDADLPIPALIDVELASGDPARVDAVRKAVQTISPAASVERQDAWLAPLTTLLHALTGLAVLVIALMVAAMVAAVVLSSRAALVTHGETIAVMHLMGASDTQIARLFERRAMLDAVFGSLLGLAGAVVVILTIGQKVGDIGAALAGQGAPGLSTWLALTLVPIGAVAIALITARVTVMRALAGMP